MSSIRRRSSAGRFLAALVAVASLVHAAPSATLEERMGAGLITTDAPPSAPAMPSFKAPSFESIEDLEAREYIEKSQWKRQPSYRFREEVEKRGLPTDFHPDLEKRWSGFLEKRSGGLFARQAAPCVPPTASAYDMNYMMWAGGANFKLQLCPNTNYNINDTIYFYNFNQEIMTQGYPTGSTRATLTVVGESQAVAIYMIWQGGSIKNIQINGNRRGLGWIGGGAALIETGGPYPGLSVQNCNLYEPRGWSALHIGEGACDNDICQCSGFQVLNNQIGPAGDAPNSSWQFKRSMEEVKRFSETPVHVLKRQAAQAPGQWADGISLACSNSIVRGNTIVDATDGMIVIFEAPGSTISGNTLITRSRVALGGIGMVDFNPWGGKYTNTKVIGNTIRTDGAMMKVGIPMGGTIWSTYNSSVWRNDGGIVQNNRFVSSGRGYFGWAIATAGMNNVVTSGNDFGSAKFNGAPSYACIDQWMPPPPQAAVYDPYSTRGGNYQAGSQPADLLLLPCIMSCEFSDQGCSWPAWYRLEDLRPTSSAASSASSSASSIRSSSASSSRAASSSSASSSRASSASSSRASSSSSSSQARSSSSSSSSSSSVRVSSTTVQPVSSTVPAAQTTSSAAAQARVTIAQKSAMRVTKPKAKRDLDEQQPVAWADANENLTEPDAAPFLQVGYGRNVYMKDHLTDAAMVL